MDDSSALPAWKSLPVEGDADDIPQLLEDIEKREAQLSAWERDFIDSVQHQVGKGRGLSDKQIAIVNRIWDKVTAYG